ncbi:MAG: M23 family metallopeptidase [Fibrobacter sp.]|nr:M23 family metallopeptidase [Fibrobacter sp.]
MPPNIFSKKRKNDHGFLSGTFLIIPASKKKPFLVSKKLAAALLLVILAGFGGLFKTSVFITSNAIDKISLSTKSNKLSRLTKDNSVLNDSLTKLIRSFNPKLIDTVQYFKRIHKSSNDSAKIPENSPVFTFPAMGQFSSFFGSRTDPINEDSAFHRGIDIADTLQSPVHCSADGVVAFAGNTPRFGNVVIVDHFRCGFQTIYAHLFEHCVKTGDTVCSGLKIGLLGSTGKSTGPHLHFEIRYEGTPLDPLQFLIPENAIID